jgi:7-cyano-7-deazaguanine synthase
MPAVALLSGGLDSTVAATHAARRGGLALALTLDYGQRAVKREIAASASITAFLEAEHRIVSLPFLTDLSDSTLTDRKKRVPKPTSEGLDDPEEARERARSVWVPNRNGLFIQVAACYAQSLGLDKIVVGFNREEAITFPDNRPEYLEACTRVLSFTLDEPVRVESPTKDLDKTGIVRLGLELDAPLHLIWSCYGGGGGHCFRCESCCRLRRALESAGAWEKLRSRLERKSDSV